MRRDLIAIVDSMRAITSNGLEEAERVMLGFEQADCPVIHHFGPGIYIRELSMRAGTIAIGHRQRHQHVNVLLKGRVLMLQDDGSTREVAAPMMYIGQPGRKIGLVLEDVVWQNIYATTETDIEKLEAMFLDKSSVFDAANAAELLSQIAQHDEDRADYRAMLDEYGFSDEAVRAQSDHEGDQVPFPPGSWRVKTGPSPIEGRGLFATSDIAAGDLIAPARVNGMRTPAGRYTNHAAQPNARMVLLPNGDISVVALRDISGCRGGQDGDEITIDYRQALSLSGVTARKELQ